MSSPDILLGEERPRRLVLAAALVLPVVMTLAFLLSLDTVVPLAGVSLVCVLGVAFYAGWHRGGVVTAELAVFLTVWWWYVVPPIVGLLRGFERYPPARYRPPSLSISQPVWLSAELQRGLQEGPLFAAFVAVVCGGLAFAAGWGARVGAARYREHSGTRTETTDGED